MQTWVGELQKIWIYLLDQFMGAKNGSIGEPWLSAGYYVPGTPIDRIITGNPADPPSNVTRVVGGPETLANDTATLNQVDYADMRESLENTHDDMHSFVNMGGPHISFRDPFVFLLHSNVDRLVARWQTDPTHPERLNPNTVYGTETNLDVQVFGIIQNVNHNS